jgi:hypothetical protein
MNYKTILLCAVIGTSMQNAWAMDRLVDEELEQHLARLLKETSAENNSVNSDAPISVPLGVGPDGIPFPVQSGSNNSDSRYASYKGVFNTENSEQEVSEIAQSAATIKALQQIVAERDAQLQVNDARIKELESIINTMCAASDNENQTWLDSLE